MPVLDEAGFEHLLATGELPRRRTPAAPAGADDGAGT